MNANTKVKGGRCEKKDKKKLFGAFAT